MSVDQARRWLIQASMLVTGSNFLFFAIAPAFGYPLEWSESLRLLQIVLPVFVGYLGSATYFVFNDTGAAPAARHPSAPQFLGLMVRGPVIIWGAGSLAAIAAFGYVNRIGASGTTSGMSLETLAALLTAALGLLTATTNVAIAYLFGKRPNAAMTSDVHGGDAGTTSSPDGR